MRRLHLLSWRCSRIPLLVPEAEIHQCSLEIHPSIQERFDLFPSFTGWSTSSGLTLTSKTDSWARLMLKGFVSGVLRGVLRGI